MKRAVIIGCGDVSVVHAEGISQIEDATLVGVCDTDVERARNLARKYNVPYFSSYHDLVENLPFDVAHVATPHNMHANLTVDLLERGYHVLQEKPLAHSLEAGKAIVDASEKASGKIGICFQNRYNVSSQILHAYLANAELGTITGAYANMVWSRDANYYRSRPWRGTWEGSGGGLLMNQAIHTIDLLHWFMGGISSVSGSVTLDRLRSLIEVDESAHLFLTHPNGATSTMYATLANTAHRPVELEIYTDKATATIRDGLTIQWNDGHTEYYPERHAASSGRTYWGVSHEILFRDFYSTLESPEAFWISPREAYESLKTAQTIYEHSSLR
ncbi:Gfo/Idh/MocA family protein [Arcanobacterium canis]